MAGRQPPQLLQLLQLLLLLGVALFADHVTGQALLLSPNRTEHVAFVGQSLYVTCRGRNPVGMVWVGPNGEEIVKRTGPVHVEPSRPQDGLIGVELLLTSVKTDDRGQYRCQARVNGVPEESSFELEVLQPIEFREEDKVQFANVGKTITLRCNVTGQPEPTVKWRGVGRPLDIGPDRKYDIDRETNGLVIRNVTRRDGGKYRCKASQVNALESDVRYTDIELKILFMPEWTGPHESKAYGFLGGNASISCQAEARPKPGFVWYHEDEMVEDGDHYKLVDTENKSVLQINYLDDSMFGEYLCKAWNQHGDINRTIELKMVEKPAIPRMKVAKVGSSQLSLSIVVPPEGPPASRYRAEYRTADAAWPAASSVEFQPGEEHVIKNLQPETEYVVRVAVLSPAGSGDFSASLRQTTAAVSTGDGSPDSSQSLMLSLSASLLMAALLVL